MEVFVFMARPDSLSHSHARPHPGAWGTASESAADS